MLYELKRGRIGIVTYEELQNDYVMYDFPKQTVEDCKGDPYNFRSKTYVSSSLIFAVLDILNFQDVFGEKDRLALYIRGDLCLVVEIKDEDESIRGLFNKVIQWYEEEGRGLLDTVPEEFLYHFLDRLTWDDRKFLENMEFHMSVLETRILKERVDPAFINEILSMKKELMYIWNYYEQLIDVGEALRDDEYDLFPQETIKRYVLFTDRMQRLNENVKYLKEYTVQLRETHDAMLDYNLNSIMKLFTVITTIFLPLTLIVGWYGMNFEYMPELHWRYGYVSIILISAMVVVGCIVAFKKYRLL